MKLVGYYASPYVRRVAITLKLYGVPYQHLPLATVADCAAIKAYNPTGRIPALVLDTGEVLTDSSLIIDYLDEIAGAELALTPPRGPERREVLSIVGLALAATDKYVAAFYEIAKRPETHVWRPWKDQLESQVTAALTALDARVRGPYFLGACITQADVALVAAVESMRIDMQHLAPRSRYPRLDRVVDAVAHEEAFATTRPTP